MIVHDLKVRCRPRWFHRLCLDARQGHLAADQKKLLTLGAKSGKDLLRLIQNLLDVAKMGKLQLRRDTFSVLGWRAQCLDDLEAQICGEQSSPSRSHKGPAQSLGRSGLGPPGFGQSANKRPENTRPGPRFPITWGPTPTATTWSSACATTAESPQGLLIAHLLKFSQAGSNARRTRGQWPRSHVSKLAVQKPTGGRVWVESGRPRQRILSSLPLVKPVEDAAPAGSPRKQKASSAPCKVSNLCIMRPSPWPLKRTSPIWNPLCVNALRFWPSTRWKGQLGPSAPHGSRGPRPRAVEQIFATTPKPGWTSRDRFVLSCSPRLRALYGLLHLTGYPVSLDDIKQFRQWGSPHAGHPRTRPHRRGETRPAPWARICHQGGHGPGGASPGGASIDGVPLLCSTTGSGFSCPMETSWRDFRPRPPPWPDICAFPL